MRLLPCQARMASRILGQDFSRPAARPSLLVEPGKNQTRAVFFRAKSTLPQATVGSRLCMVTGEDRPPRSTDPTTDDFGLTSSPPETLGMPRSHECNPWVPRFAIPCGVMWNDFPGCEFCRSVDRGDRVKVTITPPRLRNNHVPIRAP